MSYETLLALPQICIQNWSNYSLPPNVDAKFSVTILQVNVKTFLGDIDTSAPYKGDGVTATTNKNSC